MNLAKPDDNHDIKTKSDSVKVTLVCDKKTRVRCCKSKLTLIFDNRRYRNIVCPKITRVHFYTEPPRLDPAINCQTLRCPRETGANLPSRHITPSLCRWHIQFGPAWKHLIWQITHCGMCIHLLSAGEEQTNTSLLLVDTGSTSYIVE